MNYKISLFDPFCQVLKLIFKIYVILTFAIMACNAEAAARKLTIEVVDSISGEALAYTAIYLRGSQQGTMANDNGVATIIINSPRAELEFSAMGYAKKIVEVEPTLVAIRVMLSPVGHQLEEVTVKRKREHYSKRNNPAVDFVRRIRDADSLTDPRRNPYYNYTRYERITLGLNKFDGASKPNEDSLTQSKKHGRFDFLREHVDTSAVTGEPVLPLIVKEKVADVLYRRSPRSEKEYLLGIRQAGVDEIGDAASLQVLMEDVFREIDLYQNDINILQNRFVSPLSRIAPDFYKFYLTDTITDPSDGRRLIELSFAPRNPAAFGFIGRLYVEEGDTTMFVRRVRMNVPPSINLNFVDHLQIVQEFDRAPGGSRLKILDDFNVELSLVRGTQGLYVHRTTAYKNHSFEPSVYAELYDRPGGIYSDPMVYARDDSFWEEERQVKASANEKRIDQLMERLREVKLYYYAEKVLRIIFQGYVQTGNPSKVDLGPVNTLISGNSVEGVRLRVGGVTTANFSPHWFGKGYVAYGTKDRRWKYGTELEYSFNEKEYHPNEFPIHSVKISEIFDVDQIGQHYLFTNPDNVVLTLKRMENKLMTYRRQTRLDYTLELANNFSVRAGANLERQEATTWVPFINGYGDRRHAYNELLFTLQLRYAPGEKFYQTRSERIPINQDAPVLILTHTYAPAGAFGAPFAVNKTELSVAKRVWLSAFGFVDMMVKGGHVWSSSPFINLLIPNANLSYTIQPESFALMNPMEFIHDSAVSWDVTYWANGAIFNNIPLLKKLKLREVFAFRGWLGVLSDRNNPLCRPELFRFPATSDNSYDNPYQSMHTRPYMEISAGLDNLFKCLRIDYVWRLTYRTGQPASSRSGLRVALHVTF